MAAASSHATSVAVLGGTTPVEYPSCGAAHSLHQGYQQAELHLSQMKQLLVDSCPPPRAFSMRWRLRLWHGSVAQHAQGIIPMVLVCLAASDRPG